jgi:hypothetical protein
MEIDVDNIFHSQEVGSTSKLTSEKRREAYLSGGVHCVSA